MMKNYLIAVFSLLLLLASLSSIVKNVSSQPVLVLVKLNGTVGISLDEVEEGNARNNFVDRLMGQDLTFWENLAKNQVQFTEYYLVNRRKFNVNNFTNFDSLPLPSENEWMFEFDESVNPSVEKFNELSFLTRDYYFYTYLLGDLSSLMMSEAALSEVGDSYEENFQLPVDPQNFFQKSGYNCLDLSNLPPKSIDSSNARFYFSQYCTKFSSPCSNPSYSVNMDCEADLTNNVGSVQLSMEFEIIPFNSTLADLIRTGTYTSSDKSDIAVCSDCLENFQVGYRYISENSCEETANCVKTPGWRKLLKYSASLHNSGLGSFSLGDPNDGYLDSFNLFDGLTCQLTKDYSLFGDLSLKNDSDSDIDMVELRSVCVKGSRRAFNNENSTFSDSFDCDNQGLTYGWSVDYNFGTSCQYLDITEQSANLTIDFQFNPLDFVCEGDYLLNPNNSIVITPTNQKNVLGNRVGKPNCTFTQNYQDNNFASVDLPSTLESTTILPCSIDNFSSRRDCGLTPVKNYPICLKNEPTTIACYVKTKNESFTVPSFEQHFVRVCDYSSELKTGVDCTYSDSLANTLVTYLPNKVYTLDFSCPDNKDDSSNSKVQRFSIYSGAFFDDSVGEVQCSCLKNCQIIKEEDSSSESTESSSSIISSSFLFTLIISIISVLF